MDQCKREKPWENIGQYLKIGADKAKEAWNKLLLVNCFCNMKNVETAIRLIPWRFEQQVTFLLPSLDNQLMQSNLNKSESQTYQTSAAKKLDEENDTVIGHPKYDDDESVSRNDDIGIETPPSPDMTNTTNNSEPEIEKQNRRTKYERKLTKQQLTSLSDLDTTDAFFLNMSKMTKQLPPTYQAKIKLRVSHVVLESEVKYQEVQDDNALLFARLDKDSSQGSMLSSSDTDSTVWSTFHAESWIC